MPDPNFIILYVDSPLTSADFYTGLLGKPPVEASSAFVMYVLESGVHLGLWSRRTVLPIPTANAGGSELAFTVADIDTVRSLHDDWVRRGLDIVQVPTDMDFGHTFVALDPDGHRLRVYAPSPA